MKKQKNQKEEKQTKAKKMQTTRGKPNQLDLLSYLNSRTVNARLACGFFDFFSTWYIIDAHFVYFDLRKGNNKINHYSKKF